MGDINCKMLPEESQPDHIINNITSSMASYERPQKAQLNRPQANTNEDDGERPLITTSRNHSPSKRESVGRVQTQPSQNSKPTPRTKSVTYKRPNQLFPKVEQIYNLFEKKAKTRTALEVSSTVERLLECGKQAKRKIEIKRKQKSILSTKAEFELEKKQWTNKSPSRKPGDFIKSQQEFLEKKIAAIERSRVLTESKMAEKCTYKPQINENSRRLSERLKKKNNCETPVNLLSKTSALQQTQEARGLGESSPLKLRSIYLASQPSKKVLKIKKTSQSSSMLFPSDRSSRNHLANKIIKEFNAALAALTKTTSQSLNYLQFCEVAKMMGMASKNSDCNSFSQAQERALLIEAFRIVAEGEFAGCWPVLNFIMAVFGMDLVDYWGKICEECYKGQNLSKYINQSFKESGKKTQGVTPSKDNIATPDRFSDLKNYNYSPIQFHGADPNIKQPRDTLGQTRSFQKFQPDEITLIQHRFKSFYTMKMSQTRGYSEILVPLRKSREQRDRTNSAGSKSSLSKKKRDIELSTNHKSRLFRQAEELGIIHPSMAPLDSKDILHLEKLVTLRQSELKKEEFQSLELQACPFKPKTISSSESRQPERYLYLYEQGKDKQRFKTDQPYEESLDECTFQPNITKSSKSKSSRPKQPDYHEHPCSSHRLITKASNPSQRILQINVDLGHQQKIVSIHRGDDPRVLARRFLGDNQLSPALLDRLSQIIEQGMAKAETLKS